jgi:tetratricopeptide (TPR) repeat protein
LLGARIYEFWINDQASNGKPYETSATKAEKFARTALKTDPENGLAYRTLGNLYQSLARGALYTGKNPVPFLDLANANYEKAIIRIPEDEDLNTLVGLNTSRSSAV